jgi:23S rRNA pseudoU1915 N3-methylase RlmH
MGLNKEAVQRLVEEMIKPEIINHQQVLEVLRRGDLQLSDEQLKEKRQNLRKRVLSEFFSRYLGQRLDFEKIWKEVIVSDKNIDLQLELEHLFGYLTRINIYGRVGQLDSERYAQKSEIDKILPDLSERDESGQALTATVNRLAEAVKSDSDLRDFVLYFLDINKKTLTSEDLNKLVATVKARLQSVARFLTGNAEGYVSLAPSVNSNMSLSNESFDWAIKKCLEVIFGRYGGEIVHKDDTWGDCFAEDLRSLTIFFDFLQELYRFKKGEGYEDLKKLLEDKLKVVRYGDFALDFVSGLMNPPGEPYFLEDELEPKYGIKPEVFYNQFRDVSGLEAGE